MSIFNQKRLTLTLEGRLLLLAALFLGIYCLGLTISPMVISRGQPTALRWSHWVGYLVWLIGFAIAIRESSRSPHDPYLLPVISLLSGWGLLTIWRLLPNFGARQTIWLALGLAVFILGLRFQSILGLLQRYKNIWMLGGLLITALTLFFGTNPMGYGPRLWLGCCGVYLQPSEPLKLLLIIYLAAYCSTSLSHVLNTENANPAPPNSLKSRLRALASSLSILPVILPTIIVTGIAITILIIQRDLGTATLILFLYSSMLYIVTGWKIVPFLGFPGIILAGFLGYRLFDVVRLRIEAWINPWLDPSGRSFQIVQSLMAVANGGIIGRGPGMGSPALVPVAHSDFVFTTISEETGLLGTLIVFSLIAILVYRGFHIAVHAATQFHSYLAAGLTSYICAQSILIIGGNLRLLPLTGVTLPFVSYGGSSLLVSFTSILILTVISKTTANKPSISVNARSARRMSLFLLFGILSSFAINTWWAAYRGPDLLTRTDNPRRSIADTHVTRGAILDVHNKPIVESVGIAGNLFRWNNYPFGSVIGYTHIFYGQSGIEADLDPILRGTEGNKLALIWWHHLLYGEPPAGLDIRLTIDIDMQTYTDRLLSGSRSGLVLLNSNTGDILTMSSNPTFDANVLDNLWDKLISDESSPLLNRVTLGLYPLGDLAASLFNETNFEGWREHALNLRIPVLVSDSDSDSMSPLQLALYASSLSNGGKLPAVRIVDAIKSSASIWESQTALGAPKTLLSRTKTKQIIAAYMDETGGTWHLTTSIDDADVIWFIGGTHPDNSDASLTLVLVMEGESIIQADMIGKAVLAQALLP